MSSDMQTKKFVSIKKKLITVLGVSAFIAIILSSMASFYYSITKQKADALSSLSQMTTLIGNNLKASVEFSDAESATNMLNTFNIDPNVLSAYIFEGQNELFASYVQDVTLDKKLFSHSLELLKKSEHTQSEVAVDDEYITTLYPVISEGEYLATFMVVYSTEFLSKAIFELVIVYLAITVLTILVVLLLSFKMHKTFTAPIDKLKDAMEEVSQKSNYDVAINEQRDDEYQMLFDGFDNMLSTISTQQHELETHNANLNNLVEEKTKDIQKKSALLEASLATMDRNVIFSKTDIHGKITQVSQAFCDISGYSEEEMLGKNHNIVRHPDMPSATFKEIWETIKGGRCWFGEVKNLKKGGGFYWVSSKIEPEYDLDGELVGYYAIRQNITAKKEVEDLSKNLEKKVEERTKEVQEQKEFVTTVLDSQAQIIVTTDGSQLVSVNRSFLTFFGIETLEEFDESCICGKFDTDAPEGYLQVEMDGVKWTQYVLDHPNKDHLAMITQDDVSHIFTVSVANLPKHTADKALLSVVFSDITELENEKRKNEEIHQNVRDSIDYAAIIQGSLIPSNDLFRKYFSDYFAIWHPKDTVGGDIYLFEELRHDHECLLMVIDCTGHGVPGAFVTMLVKAIERQIVSRIINSDEVVSPANLLKVFSKSMKHLLHQYEENSVSNAGFDGGIIYYNKLDGIIKYAGANTPLFYVEDGKINVIKSDRHSIGYVKSDENYEFKDHIIEAKDGMHLYISTDGYLDQNGGDKGFCFGKKRFQNMIMENYQESLADQQELFLDELDTYMDTDDIHYAQTDDVTVIAIKI
jgi:PAS domain S-box-containing protein